MDINHRRCAINDYCVYSIYKSKTLVKYNLFTGKTYIVFRSDNNIHQYYISKNTFIFMECSRLYWNGIKLGNICDSYLRYVKIKSNEYIVSYIGNKIINYCNEIIIKWVPYFIVSLNGQMIVYKCDDGDLYKQNMSCASMNELFHKDYGTKLTEFSDTCVYLRWIPNCNYILINDDIIYNLDNNCIMKTITPVTFFFAFFVNGLIIVWHYGFVEIYDTWNMVFVQKIDTQFVFGYYNQLLDVLVTDQRKCYRLQNNNNQYYFQHIIFGVNYIMDYKVVPQNIKTIIDMLYMTVFDALPNEIACIDLYQQLLIYVS